MLTIWRLTISKCQADKQQIWGLLRQAKLQSDTLTVKSFPLNQQQEIVSKGVVLWDRRAPRALLTHASSPRLCMSIIQDADGMLRVYLVGAKFNG